MDILKSHDPESGRSKRNGESGFLDSRDSLSRWRLLLLPLSVFSECLVCIVDLCSNGHIYLCCALNVAAKHELLKEKKIKEGGKPSNAGITLSVDEERFLLCAKYFLVFHAIFSKSALSPVRFDGNI